MNISGDWNPSQDEMSGCVSLEISFSKKTFLTFVLVFLGSVIFSITGNGYLCYLTVRYKQLLWQPQYILLKNISACGAGMSLTTAFAVFLSVLQKKTQVYGCWCIAQFCILRCFFLTSQFTLALMAIERYIFICHGIHYLRTINTHNVGVSIGLIWLVSGAVSFHGGYTLSQMVGGLQQETTGLLCDAITIKEHLRFSTKEDMLVFGPPSVLTVLCILTICYCYGCMYHAALKVSMVLKCSHRRATCTVGLYFLMFLLQLALNIFFVILTLTSTSCGVITSLVAPLLITVPPCISAAFFASRNPQIKQLLLRECPSAVNREEFHQSSSADRTGDPSIQAEEEPEGELNAPPPLPGYIHANSEDF